MNNSKRNIFVVGDNYPKVGDKIYWKDQDGEIHEDTCLKIEEEDNHNLETMYFTYLSKNGGGSFITESDIINPLSVEIEIYKKNKFKQRVKEISDLFKQDEFKEIISVAYKNRYGEEGGIEMLEKIVDLLGNEENYK